VHNYHSTYGGFPIGARPGTENLARLGQNTIRKGTNWKTSILAQLEHAPLFDQLDFKIGMFAADFDDNEILIDKVVSIYKCPSSPFGPFEADRGAGYNKGTMKHEYVGIMGAYPDPGGRGSDTCNRGSHGWVCRNGLLTVNENKQIRHATDGTSHTLLAAEQSGEVAYFRKRRGWFKAPIRANYAGGWAGAISDFTADECEGEGCSFHALTTVMFKLNAPTVTKGFSDQAGQNNTILNSSHQGVVQVVQADGSALALSDGLDMETLRRLCSADDGMIAGDYGL